MRVYVAAPYIDAEKVRLVHAQLISRGMLPVSDWADTATGKEDLASMPIEDVRAVAMHNDLRVDSAQAVLVLARPDAGAEMYAEASRAILRGTFVVWLGHRPLSAYRHRVLRADSLDEALTALMWIQRMVD